MVGKNIQDEKEDNMSVLTTENMKNRTKQINDEIDFNEIDTFLDKETHHNHRQEYPLSRGENRQLEDKESEEIPQKKPKKEVKNTQTEKDDKKTKLGKI